MNSEVLIIGGGVMGLLLARELHKKGIGEITIAERDEIGKESSFAAAGMLTPQAESDQIDDFFRFSSDSRDLYPKLADELFDETGIDIELDQTGTLFLAFDRSDAEEINKRFELQKNAGIEVEHLSAAETHKLEPFASPDLIESLFFPNDWQVENPKLLRALRKYAEINGIKLLEQTQIKNLRKKGEKIFCAVSSNGKEFFADHFVIASGAWSSLIDLEEAKLPMPKVKPIRGQMLSFHTAKRLFSHVIYSPRGYIVPRKQGRILAGSTLEDVGFEKKTTEEAIETIRENTLEITPAVANLPIDRKWSGLRPKSADGVPIIGNFSGIENLFAATAHYRNGILLAPMTARILTDKIVRGIDSKYLEIFSPNRLTTAKTI